nr:hypothetical protein [Tuwongella immobilis]
MVVAMVAVRVVQVTIDEVIDMVAMRHRRVTAIGAVNVIFSMAGAGMRGRATCGIGCRHRQGVLFHAAGGHVVQVAIVEIIHMAFVLDANVTAVRAMDMVMRAVMMFAHI